MDQALAGKHALVTGGGRGIGRSIAIALARAGADVAVAARTQAQLDAVAGEIRALGRRAFAIPIDLTQRDHIEERINQAAEQLGGLDILVNNAGGSIGAAAQIDPVTHDPQTFEDCLFFNLTQVFYVTRAALPYMIKKNWGRILNTGSGSAARGGAILAYTAAKHGLIGYTRSLAYAVARHGINVNVINPGWTNTSMVDFERLAKAMNTTVEGARQFANSQSIQRRVVEPDELGPMAVLLCSDAGSAVTGQVVYVDGGFKV
ncbi:MAG TPA: SDR family NAD(P)-dependent oxidoreductase [Candidatus Binataceae bacterium]|jgi:meso-butanediol dehydrogenase/(S,S)-butanediol dehydrogenase/diacetyl reductase|nr:SDR family NAD(P)-dependent oxidoreductase [Candidatus Binataceae bacterium]